MITIILIFMITSKRNMVKKQKLIEKSLFETISFLKKYKLQENSISFLKIDNDLNNWPIRIYVSIDEDKIKMLSKPKYIRELEEFLRKKLDNKIQIYYEESKDRKIRRL